jgi:hypothetical protein
MRNSGWPGIQPNDVPAAITPPWTTLEQRRIPYLEERAVKALSLVEARPIDSYFQESGYAEAHPRSIRLTNVVNGEIDPSGYADGNAPLVIPAGATKTWFLLFDMGELLNGLPQFVIEGAPGTNVEVIGIPFVPDAGFTYRVVDADLLDRVTLSGRRDTWQAQYFKPTRYLALVVRVGQSPLKIHSLGVHSLSYPFVRQGYIRSSAMPWLSRYVQASEKTIEACTIDGYTDNYRERRQYAQTGYYAALGNYWTFGDQALQARKLFQVAQEAQPNGIYPAYGPLIEEDYMVILDSNLLWIRSLHNYLLYSGDYDSARALLPTALRILALVETFTNENGLIDSPPFAYWLDHARIDRRGANLALNGHYIGALEDTARLLGWLGNEGGDKYVTAAAKARDSIRKMFFNLERGLFADALIGGIQSDQFSEHAQAMALALRIATSEQAETIALQLLADDESDFIRRENGMFMVTPAMSYFLHKGLAEYGYVDESMALFKRRFDHMLRNGPNGTFWEEWWLRGSGRTGQMGLLDRTRSDAQTESAFAPALFAEYLLGVQPTRPGMTELIVRRTESEIGDIEATFPTPQGRVTVAWAFGGNNGALELNLPMGVTASIDTHSLLRQGHPVILVNGKSIDSGGRYIKVQGGTHIITFKRR